MGANAALGVKEWQVEREYLREENILHSSERLEIETILLVTLEQNSTILGPLNMGFSYTT